MPFPAIADLPVNRTRPVAVRLKLRPWQAFEAVLRCPYPLFFDSALQHPTLGRYSYVTADPFAVLRSRGKSCEWQSAWSLTNGRRPTNPFIALGEVLSRFRAEPQLGLPPFQGGAAGLFAYDLCHHLERLPRPRIDDFQTPDLVVGLYDWVCAFDHVEGRAWLISTGFPETEPARRERRVAERLDWARRMLEEGPRQKPAVPKQARLAVDRLAPQHPLPGHPGVTSTFSRPEFLAAVRRAIEYVHAGDCFQVNVAQRLLKPQREAPVALYRRLRERNPATFAGYFDLGDFVIASASPERFLQTDAAGRVETRPIKGTRPRGNTPAEDARLLAELRASPKDRAENIMIVDLLRNDLGRVCEYGSIRVPALCDVETYETVHHLVSQVTGRLRPDRTALDLLQAAFPGGSVTGAPKIRAMEIIAELEPTARGPYCGCLGWIGFDGAMDTNILIRTFTIGPLAPLGGEGGVRGAWVQFPVGGGIVADSDPEREYEETLHKAAGLLRALE